MSGTGSVITNDVSLSLEGTQSSGVPLTVRSGKATLKRPWAAPIAVYGGVFQNLASVAVGSLTLGGGAATFPEPPGDDLFDRNE